MVDGNTLDLDVNTNKYNHYKLIGPTGNFQVGGITAAEHDRIITLYNRSGHSLEVYNDDVNASASNRILTGTGGTFAVYPGGSLTLKYDNTINKWEITASHYNSLDNFGSGNWSLSGNDIYNANVGNVGINTTTPLTSLQVNGNLSLVSDTILTPCSSMFFNGKILIDNTIKKRSVFHILKDNSCSTNLAPDILGLAGGTDGQIVSLIIHMDNSRVQHLKGLDMMPSSVDSMNMIELFEPNSNGNINQPSYLTFNAGGAFTLIYDGLRKRWKPVNYYGEVKPAETFGWVAGGTPNSIVNPNGGNKVGIGFFSPTEQLHVGGNIKTIANVIIDGEIKPNGVSGANGEVLTNLGNGTMDWLPSVGWTTGPNPNDIYSSNSGNVGIGTNTPTNKLQVVDNNLTSGFMKIGANVAIGTPKLLKFGDGDYVTIGENYEDDLMELKASKFFLTKQNGTPIVSIGSTNSGASLSAVRGFGTDGTAAFFGTTHSSHFNYSANEDTYIRGGKNGSKVIINDGTLGNVGIGTNNPEVKLHIQGGFKFTGAAFEPFMKVLWTDFTYNQFGNPDYYYLPTDLSGIKNIIFEIPSNDCNGYYPLDVYLPNSTTANIGQVLNFSLSLNTINGPAGVIFYQGTVSNSTYIGRISSAFCNDTNEERNFIKVIFDGSVWQPLAGGGEY